MEIGLEANDEKTKYMIMNRDQNAGGIHNMKIDDRSFESGEELKFRKKLRAD
jgi:hypothetical protein